MEQRVFLGLLVLFLGFSFVVSTAAVPTSRTLKMVKEEYSLAQDALAQDVIDMTPNEELLELEEGFIEGRMDIETNDYPKTGANNHHDPKTPGKV